MPMAAKVAKVLLSLSIFPASSNSEIALKIRSKKWMTFNLSVAPVIRVMKGIPKVS